MRYFGLVFPIVLGLCACAWGYDWQQGGHDSGMMDSLSRMEELNYRDQQRGLQQIKDAMQKIRMQRLDNLFYQWPDKSRQGILNFGRTYNVPADLLFRYLRLAQ